MPDWNQILKKIEAQTAAGARAADSIRRNYLKQLQKHTKRNVIAYYSGSLSKPNLPSEVNHEDLNGFMQSVHGLNRDDGLDLILHTEGGQVSAALSIVHYLRKMFGSNIRAIVPQFAMSAGTMIACSCKSIVLAKHSQLGPIDPQMRGIAAAGVREEFDRACRECIERPERIPIWQKIIGQYPPTFLSQCENAVELAKSFVTEQLEEVMFAGSDDARAKAESVVKVLTDYSGNKGHDRPIHVDECDDLGLKIKRLEDDSKLQDLVLTIHHCYMHVFMNGPAYKAIENHLGNAIVRNDVSRR